MDNRRRELTGSFYTPQIWVELSQKYLTDLLGNNWQDEYYIWDCAAGTGNLLAGLTNKYNIWASTIDPQDVEIIKDRITNGENLLEEHIFQFDFLNDSFDKLPKQLQEIVDNPEKRRQLVIYINPPYLEVSSYGTKGKIGVNKSQTHNKYISKLGTAGREIYTQFMIRIYDEINGCLLAEFSTLKTLQGSAFEKFRKIFEAKLERCFIVPANTFDNVKGHFPIGFKIWNTNKRERFSSIISDVYNENAQFIDTKKFSAYLKHQYINKWISSFKIISDNNIGFLAGTNGNDFQTNNIVYILNNKEQMANPRGIWIAHENLIQCSIYYAVRHCIKATWLNDRDQFLYPNNNWLTDLEFQHNCLIFTLFNNNIQSKYGINHWIPFAENQVNSSKKFDSNFMNKFINGKLKIEGNVDIYNRKTVETTEKLEFSTEAQAVFEAGRELWKYYHNKFAENFSTVSNFGKIVNQTVEYNVNASLYDIREYFQGRNEKGKMNNKSKDKDYTKLINNLRDKLNILAQKIEPKVYEYEFLKK